MAMTEGTDHSVRAWVVDVLVGWLAGSILVGVLGELLAAVLFGAEVATALMPLFTLVGTVGGIIMMRRRRREIYQRDHSSAPAQPWSVARPPRAEGEGSGSQRTAWPSRGGPAQGG